MNCNKIIFILFLFLSRFAYADPLIFNLSETFIPIDFQFSGKAIYLFGARTKPGEVFIVIKGENRSYLVRKKEKILGFWVNRKPIVFDIPNFLHIVYDQNNSNFLYDNYDITSYNNVKDICSKINENLALCSEFLDALIRHLEKKSLYKIKNNKLSIFGEMLFQYKIYFPERIEKGKYIAETYLVDNNKMIASQTSSIIAEKKGFDAFIYNLAYKNSYLYGLSAVFIAIFSGWIAGVIFNRYK